MKKDNKDSIKETVVNTYNNINEVITSLSVFVASNESKILLNNIKSANESFYKNEINNIDKSLDKDENDNKN